MKKHLAGRMSLAVILAASALTLSSVPTAASTTDQSGMSPSRELVNWRAELSGPSGVALDQGGRLYVANRSANTVTVYPADWSTTKPTPVKVLKGPATGLVRPRAIAFDSLGLMYVVNSDSVTVYAQDWAAGDTAPVKQLRGANTALVDPRGIAFDPSDRMYVVNSHDTHPHGSGERVGSVVAFPREWPSGDTSPDAILQGPNTFLDRPHAIAFDYQGRTYVANSDSITVYAPSWLGGDLAPTHRLTGPATGLSRPSAIAFDEHGIMYVANSASNTITTYDTDWPGTSAVPLSTLSGARTYLSGPTSLTIGEGGSVVVANAGSDIVTEYLPSHHSVTLTESSSVSYALISPTQLPTVQMRVRRVTVTAASSMGSLTHVISQTPRVCVGQGFGTVTLELKRPGVCILHSQVLLPEPWSTSPALTRSFTVRTSAQVLDVPSIADLPLSKRWTTVRASSSSGLPVTITSTTPTICRPSFAFGHRIRLLSVGTCSLQMLQQGNEFWESARGSLSFKILADDTSTS